VIHKFPGLPHVNLCRDLTREEVWILDEWGVPKRGPITDRDLKKAKVVRNPAHRRRLEKRGLPPGRWFGGVRITYPVELATFLLSLGEEPPEAMTRRSLAGLDRARQATTKPKPKAKPATKPRRAGARLATIETLNEGA
jgi:hypothetical protein